jgi:hypothetical protein
MKKRIRPIRQLLPKATQEMKDTPLIAENHLELLQLQKLGFTNVVCVPNNNKTTQAIVEFEFITAIPDTDKGNSDFINNLIKQYKL